MYNGFIDLGNTTTENDMNHRIYFKREMQKAIDDLTAENDKLNLELLDEIKELKAQNARLIKRLEKA